MRVLLINPPVDIYPGEFISIVPPLGLAYIAAVLEKENHEVKILDCLALSWREPVKVKRGKDMVSRLSPTSGFIARYMREFKPQVVGISNLVAPTEKETLRLAREIKKLFPRVPVVVGGSNASVRFPVFVKDKNIDFVVIGEGEETMKELVRALETGSSLRKIAGLVFKNNKGKIIINSPRELIRNLDRLPFPAWHLLPMEEYFHGQPAGTFLKKKRFATVLTSRGCPNACNFCTNEKIWERRWRARSVKNVMAEIRLLRKVYKVKEIQFVDSNISVNKKRFKKLCRALSREGLSWFPAGGMAVLTIDSSLVPLMAKSGCYALQFGIEHGDPEMQRRIGKIVPLEATSTLVSACKKTGIWAHGNFIIGLPGETKESAYGSLEYAISSDLDSVSFFTALPLPGSKVYQEVFGDKEPSMNNLRFYISKTKCSNLSNNEIQKIIKISFQKFLIFRVKRELNPFQLINRLRYIQSLDDFRFYLRILKRFVQIQMIQ